MTIVDGKLFISRDEDDYEIIARYYPSWPHLHAGIIMEENAYGLKFSLMADRWIEWAVWRLCLRDYVRHHKSLHDTKARGIIVGSDTDSLSTINLSVDDPTESLVLINLKIDGPNYVKFELGKLTVQDVTRMGEFFTEYAKELRDAN